MTSGPVPAASTAPAGHSRWVVWAFFALLTVHVALVLNNLSSGSLVGLEFRQTQTAISCLFIQSDNDFSLAYPTPVLGKPWSIPMEFPLYQWSTVWLSNATGWSLTVCARLLSALSFYATLPALGLLLGRLGLRGARRWLILGVVLSSPLYVFYSRAFLIEAMALAFSVWFLAAFVETMQQRSWRWLGLALICGAGGSLVKVTTFMVWCLPGAVYGVVLLWRDWRSGGAGRAGKTLSWGLAASVPVLLVAWWWVRLSDRIKLLNVAGADLVSSRLSGYNFGHWSDRVSPEIWTKLFRQWDNTVMPLWLAAGLVGLALCCQRALRRQTLLALGLFLAAQLIFPQLYSIHDYYFYAAGVGLLLAAGCSLAGMLDGRLPRPLVWLAWCVLILANLNHYRTGYYQLQKIPNVGGSGLTDAIRQTSPRDSVIIIMGDDWSSIIPYYSQRRALMIRRDLEANYPYIDRAFADLRGEDIYALVVLGGHRTNRPFIEHAVKWFNLDPHVTFSYGDYTDVYVRRYYRNDVLRRMGSNDHPYFNQVVIKGEPDGPADAARPDGIEHFVTTDERDKLFATMTPRPVRYNFAYQIQRFEHEGRQVIGAHPLSTLWFVPPGESSRIQVEFGILPGAYADAAGHTDGADFAIIEDRPDGTQKTVYQRHLAPFGNPADQGVQTESIPYAATSGAELRFTTAFGGGSSFDWCYWGKIKID